MGGAKTVDASKYISKPDSSRDIAILTAMQQSQAGQQAQQAALMNAMAQMAPQQQDYDPIQESKRLAEIGMGNVQRARELEKQASPAAAAMRQAQAKELAGLTAQEGAKQYMNDWAKRQGLIQNIETGLQDSSIGKSATYDSALRAKQNYEQQNLALQQQLLQQMQAPVGGIDPSSSIAAQQAAQGQNLQSMQNWQNAMHGNIGGYNQSVADQMAQMGVDFQNIQQTASQNQQNYQNAMMQAEAENRTAKNAMTGAYLGAVGSIAQGIGSGAMAGMSAGGGAGTGGFSSKSQMLSHTRPGTTGSFNAGIGWVPRATAV